MSPRVLVVGGGGFVGGAILRALPAEGGFAPVAGLRRARAGVAHRLMDATDAVAVASAAEGMGALVNAVLGNRATMEAATANLARAAARAQIPLIHISSMAVYGQATGLVAEDHELQAGSGYGAAKLACERIVTGSATAALNVILRPGIVYGPGGEQWIGRIARLLRAGRLGDLGEGGDGRCNLIYADDVGAAVVAALRRRAAGAFNLATPEPPRWNAFFVRLARAIGAVPVARLGARRLALESRLLAPPLQACKLMALRAGLAPGWLPEPIPSSLAALFRQDITLDSRRADGLLGFTRTEDAAGIAACAAWLRAA